MEDEVKCPKCGSTKLHSAKNGFSGSWAVGGFLIFGLIGLATGLWFLAFLGLFAGTIGSNAITITCLNCGKEFEPRKRK